jgi:5-methyltetrahydrofolate--homocysteine methyltransferase
LTEKEPFLEALKHKVLLFDGAMGTEIQKFDPKSEDFPDGKEAGSDCIETNSFGSNKLKLDEYGFGDQTVEFNKKIAQLAVEATLDFSDKPRYVVGSMGPTGFLPSSNDPDLGQKPLDEIRLAFALQAEGLILGGVDALLIETSQDILEVKLAIEGSHQAMEKIGKKVPLIANTTLDQYGKMLLGTNIQAAYTTVSDMDIDVFGLNCSTGPNEMTPSVRWLNEQNEHNLLVVPNAGMPENQGGQAVYKMTPDDMAKSLKEFITEYGKVRIIGGCCGTGPKHIEALRKVIDEKAQSDKG